MRTSILIFCIGILPVLLNAQDPWARSKAGAYVQVAYHTIPTYTELFGTDGAGIELIREVSEHTLQLYGEYGISNRTTAILSLPYRINSRGARNPDNNLMFAQEDTGSISGLGNISLAIRHQVRTGQFAVGGTLRVDLPSGKSQSSAGLRTGYDAATIQPMLAVGMGFSRFFWSAFGGFGYRTNDYSSFINAGAKAGIWFGRFGLSAFSELVLPLENGSRMLPTQDILTGLYVNDQGWLSLGLAGALRINRFMGLSVSATGAAWAQYVPKRPALSATLFFNWE